MTAPELSLPPGVGLAWYETLDSTNSEARRRAGTGAPLWIVAERQTAGRGRRDRTWTSEPGNLTATYLFAPDLAAPEAAQLSFAAALAVAETLDAYLPGNARVKWPNDVLLEGRKVAGILLESAAAGTAAVTWLAIGIGINLAHHPKDTLFPATSLVSEGVPAPPLGAVLERLAAALDRWVDIHRTHGFAPIRDAWLSRAAGLGGPLRVTVGDAVYTGLFAGLNADGALQLALPDGAELRITAGDVFFAKDAP